MCIRDSTSAATGDQPDPDTAGDDLVETIEVDADADLVTVKTLASGDATPAEGDTVTFQITVTNNGSAQATNVSLVDQLPAGITYTADTTSQGSYDPATGLFTIGTLNSGATATITISGTVDVGAGGNTIVNVTTAATGDQPDPSTVGDDLDEAVVVGTPPASVVVADIGLAKSVVGTPTLLPNGNYSVTYQLVVQNTGNVDLVNLSLVEDLAAHLGAGFVNSGNVVIVVPPASVNSLVPANANWNGSSDTQLLNPAASSSLAVGDSFALEFTAEVIASALPVPATNSVSATGDAVDENGNLITDPSGNPITATDVSDSGTDPAGSNPGEPGDFGTSDDPTPLLIPSVGLAKSAGDAVPNGDNFDVTFTLVYENNGTVDLHNLTLFDDIASEFGPAFVSASGVTVQNFSGTGIAPTANGAWVGDTTQSIITGGTANVGDSFEVQFTITIDPNASGASTNLNNQATAGGEALDTNGNPLLDSSGNPVTASDDSDNGTSATSENGSQDTRDIVFGNDPTPIQIVDLAIAKSVVGEPVLTDFGNFVVTFQVEVENTGTVNLGSLSLIEDLASQFGSAYVDAGNLTLVAGPGIDGSTISVDSAGFNGNTFIEIIDTSANNILVVGDSFTFEFDVEIDPREVTDELVNQVEGTADGVVANGDQILDSTGNPLVANDLSDSGTDAGSANSGADDDNGTSDDPTTFAPPEVPLGEISGTVFQDDNNDGVQSLGENGIAGVEIVLTGTDVFGNPVEITTFTDAFGNYTFDNLVAGTYQVTQIQPDGFEDGIDTGDPSFTIEDDLFSNIQLGFGDVFTSNTFAEQVRGGATGNPPTFQGLPRITQSQIGSLLSSFSGLPGPIYSGIPINGNADPLSLDSGRAVTGGYAATPTDDGDCCDPCGEVVDPCAEVMDACDPCGEVVDPCGLPIQEILEEGCGCGPVAPYGQVPAENLGESVIVGEFSESESDSESDSEEASDAETAEIHHGTDDIDLELGDNERLDDPSFLKRMASWLSPPNNDS